MNYLPNKSTLSFRSYQPGSDPKWNGSRSATQSYPGSGRIL